MNTSRLLALFCAGLIGYCATTVLAEENQNDEKTQKTEETEQKVDEAFLNRWKRIQTVAQQRAYETQQTRTVAGVRGAEAEDAVLDQLYYKGGVRYPSRVDLKNAITLLRESIEADPRAPTVAEQKFFIAQCYAQLGETDQAHAVFRDLVANHRETEYGKMAKEELAKKE